MQYRKQQVMAAFVFLGVVICLKNRTFAVSQTTAIADALDGYLL